MNPLIIKSEKDLYSYVTFIVKRFYRYYSPKFKRKLIDYEDLKQEAHMECFNIISKYKDKPLDELKKIVAQGIGWKICKLLKSKKEFKRIVYLEDYQQEKAINGNSLEDEDRIKYGKVFLILDDVKKTLNNDRDFEILKKRFISQYTLKDLGIEYNMSKPRVRYHIKKSLKILRKKYKNNSLLF